MKNNKKINILILLVMLTAVSFMSCSIKEEIKDEITSDVIQKDPSLLPNVMAPPLGQLRNFWYRECVWGLEETTSDECFFPTRGTDWFDGGVWNDNYYHNWTPTHRDVVATWNKLNNAISSANTALMNIGLEKPNELITYTQYRAQATFLRTYYQYLLFDLYRTFPSRSPFDLDFKKAATIYRGEKAYDTLLLVAKSIIPKMTPREDAKYGEPNRDAGIMLVAKLYLNQEVYTGKPGYDSCLVYLDKLIQSGHYNLATDYWQLFSVDNDQNYKKADDEAIFVAVYNDDQDYGVDDQVQWVKTTFHYFQLTDFSCWNGCAAPHDYLIDNWVKGTDTAKDVRWKDERLRKDLAINLGFNYGQQYDVSGKPLKDRSGNPLIFTFECPFNANEDNGVRVLKYPPRVKPVNPARCPNDFLIWRYADVLLMKAECLARANNDISGALSIVNQIRAKRKAPAVTASTKDEILNKIYIERGLELYWEGHRRQDMIRFGTFLLPKSEKPDPSPERAKILPIPQTAIDGMPGGELTQNPGY
jgi:hypothetical protein